MTETVGIFAVAQVLTFDQRSVPDRVEIVALVEEAHLQIISASVSAIGDMQRLVQVAHHVDDAAICLPETSRTASTEHRDAAFVNHARRRVAKAQILPTIASQALELSPRNVSLIVRFQKVNATGPARFMSGHRRSCIERRSSRRIRRDGVEHRGERPVKVCKIFDQAIIDPVRDAPPPASGLPCDDPQASQRFLDAGVDVLFPVALQPP